MSDQPAALPRWHAVVTSKDPALLGDLLAEEVVFRSSTVFAPKEGKALTAGYLSAALKVPGPSLRYVSQWHDQGSAVLGFEADLDGVYVQGVDILRWNADAKLVSFTVMVRPLRGLQKAGRADGSATEHWPGLNAIRLSARVALDRRFSARFRRVPLVGGRVQIRQFRARGREIIA